MAPNFAKISITVGAACELVSQTDATPQTNTLSYDTLSQPTQATVTVGGTNYSFAETYDAQNQPSTITYPSGLVLTYKTRRSDRQDYYVDFYPEGPNQMNEKFHKLSLNKVSSVEGFIVALDLLGESNTLTQPVQRKLILSSSTFRRRRRTLSSSIQRA